MTNKGSLNLLVSHHTKLFLLFIFMAVFLQACETTKNDWKKALESNSIQSYREFLLKHPESEFTLYAKNGIELLYWEQAKQINTIESYEVFLREHPEGIYEPEARKLFQTLGGMELIKASEERDQAKVRELLEKGIDIKTIGINGLTSLMIAAKKGDLDVVKLLLRMGANVNEVGRAGVTPLIWAAGHGHLEVMRVLISSGALINSRTNDGSTALFLGSDAGHTNVVEELLTNGADMEIQGRNGMTALMASAAQGYVEIVRMLLKNGADVNATDGIGQTAMMYASQSGKAQAVKILLTSGADVDLKTTMGDTALVFAFGNGHKDIVKTLVDSGSDSAVVLQRALEENDVTTIRKIVEYGIGNIEALNIGLMNTVRKLVSLMISVNINREAAMRDSPKGSVSIGFDRKLYDSDVSIIRLLLKGGANPNSLKYKGYKKPHMLEIPGVFRKLEPAQDGLIVNAAIGELSALELARMGKVNDIVNLLEEAGAK